MKATKEFASETNAEGKQDHGTDWINIKRPDERPWADNVDQYNSEESFQEILDTSVEKWKEQINKDIESAAQGTLDEGVKNDLMFMAENLIKDELLRMYKKLLEQGMKQNEIGGVLSGETGPLNNQDAFREAIAKQLLIRESVQAGLNNSDPAEMMPTEKFQKFVENTAGKDYYKDADKNTVLQDKGLYLKGYAASSLVKNDSSRDYNLKRVSDTMSEISLADDISISDTKRDERSAVIERELRQNL